MTTTLFADISSNNRGFSAPAYRSGEHRPFMVMIKATEGTGFVSPSYAPWVRAAHEHGLGVIHYHFARPEDGNPQGQMAHFWDTIREHFRRPGDFVSIDLETDTPANGAKWLREADPHLTSISETHAWCYTFLSYFEEGGVTIASKHLHIAAWGPNRPGNHSWQLPHDQTLAAWQFTDGNAGPQPHGLAGIPGNGDVNELNPALAQHVREQLSKRG